jgi:hypothetical protein
MRQARIRLPEMAVALTQSLRDSERHITLVHLECHGILHD